MNLGANSYIRQAGDFESFLDAVVELGLYWILRNQSAALVGLRWPPSLESVYLWRQVIYRLRVSRIGSTRFRISSPMLMKKVG